MKINQGCKNYWSLSNWNDPLDQFDCLRQPFDLVVVVLIVLAIAQVSIVIEVIEYVYKICIYTISVYVSKSILFKKKHHIFMYNSVLQEA